MRKARLLALAALIALLAAGCPQAETAEPTEATEPVETVEPTEATEPTEPAKTGKIIGGYDLEWVMAQFEEHRFEPDTIYPISHVVTAFVRDFDEYIFVLGGFYGSAYDFDRDYFDERVMICSIEVRSPDGGFCQRLDGFSTMHRPKYADYGFVLGDFNADGMADVMLHLYEGGTMRNEPSLFWLWDGERGEYVENAQLSEISMYSSVYLEPEKDSRVRSYWRNGAAEYGIWYYEYFGGEFVEVELEHVLYEERDGKEYVVTRIFRLIDGEMQVVEQTEEQLPT